MKLKRLYGSSSVALAILYEVCSKGEEFKERFHEIRYRVGSTDQQIDARPESMSNGCLAILTFVKISSNRLESRFVLTMLVQQC